MFLVIFYTYSLDEDFISLNIGLFTNTLYRRWI